MVANPDTDLYSPLSQEMTLEDGQQSSEGGSGLQSPIFVAAPFPTPHGNNNREFKQFSQPFRLRFPRVLTHP